jgi:DNA-binding transcriptional ArsR family regulator
MSLSEDTPIEWDVGTAYDFFVSLSVLHNPEKFGVRGSWAAGVRSRLPQAERELLQKAVDFLWPLHFVYALPTPKDSATALQALESIPPKDRLLALHPLVSDDIRILWESVSAKGAWDETDLKQMTAAMREDEPIKVPTGALRKAAGGILDLWSEAEAVGQGLLSALNCYYDSFFAEEEIRIRPILKQALDRAQALAESFALPQLLEELSQGVRLEKDWGHTDYVLAPSFWGTPLLLFGHISQEKGIVLFGARPADTSLIPGDVVPDVLYQALKAMADPTRLRILRYLNEQPRTPAELARLLRLRAPTVIHHLDALRLARLVIITLEPEGKRYALRPGAVDMACELLKTFMSDSGTT